MWKLVDNEGGCGKPKGAIDALLRASPRKGWGWGGTKLWGNEEGHRTLRRIIVFFDILLWVVWERVKFIRHIVSEGPLHSGLRDWPCVSGLGLLGVLNMWGSFAQLLAQ